jgi:hypothetical protein
MKAFLRFALLLLPLIAPTLTMAQFTSVPQDLASYSTMNQAALQQPYMSPVSNMHQQMRQRVRNRMQTQSQPMTFVGNTTVSGTTIVGGMVGSSTGDINIAPSFNIKTSYRGGMATQPGVIPTTTLAAQPGTTSTSVADAARIQADEQIRAQNAINTKTRKCGSTSAGLGLLGTVVGGLFGVPQVGAAAGAALGGVIC